MPVPEAEPPLRIQKLLRRLSLLTTHESLEKAMRFQPRSDDVLLSTGIKSGTAWIQQIMQGLRSRGDMDFDEIDSAIPFTDFYYDFEHERDLDSAQPFEPPRFFRTHFTYEMSIKGFGKHIVLVR